MFRRSVDVEGTQPGSGSKPRDRPLPVRLAGVVFLVGAVLLLLGGAYRNQANMISAGLLFLALGAVFSPRVIRHNRIMMAAFCALAILGLFYALTT